MSDLNLFSLGIPVSYPTRYSPEILYPIARPARRVPMLGCDIWTAFELSWRLPSGKPQVAVGEFVFPSSSPMLIESKSLKLYLNSLNSHVISGISDATTLISSDLSAVTQGPVRVTLYSVMDAPFCMTPSIGICLDDLEISTTTYTPTPEFLFTTHGEISETLVSHLFRSSCPVTQQPDWASVIIDYHGFQMDHAGLLRYLVSYREHQGFHEHCVEAIFTDIMERCHPNSLSVYARFTRRGGLDINPFRSTDLDIPTTVLRLIRQ